MVAKQVCASRYYISWLDLWWGLWNWCSRSRRIWKRIYTFHIMRCFSAFIWSDPLTGHLPTMQVPLAKTSFLKRTKRDVGNIDCWDRMCTRHETHSHIPIACFMVTVQRSVHVILLSPSRSSTHFSPALTKTLGSSATATHPQVIQQLLRKDNNAEQWPEEQQQKREISVGGFFFPSISVSCIYMLNESQMFDCEEAVKKKKEEKHVQDPNTHTETWILTCRTLNSPICLAASHILQIRMSPVRSKRSVCGFMLLKMDLNFEDVKEFVCLSFFFFFYGKTQSLGTKGSAGAPEASWDCCCLLKLQHDKLCPRTQVNLYI